jgi:hybrid cluster-associated redox disulfide protein
MPMLDIAPTTTIRAVVDRYPGIQAVFRAHGLPCASCHVAAYETIVAGAALHRLPVGLLVEDLNAYARAGIVPEMRVAPAQKRPLSGGKLDAHDIKSVIAVMSGKGGVGKSLVTGLLATALQRAGYAVGILDADITGPSIPRMFGVSGKAVMQDKRFEPATSPAGVKIMSINLLMENERDAVIWRGPMITGAIQQFFNDVNWGALDCLLVDLPPGTSDAPLTVLQRLPVAGVVIVNTPQQLATAVVSKAIKLAQRMQVPVLGIVENMAYVMVPGSETPLEVFGPSQGPHLVAESGAPLLGRLPIDQALTVLVDAGHVEDYRTDPFAELAANFEREARRGGLPIPAGAGGAC